MRSHSQNQKTKAPLMRLTGNSKLYLGKVHTEDQIKKLNDEEVENSLTITKLRSQVRW